MFEDGARLDDIINVLKKPTLNEDDKKNSIRLSDSAVRYESNRSFGDDNIKFEFAAQKNSGGL